jgi:hypothetical protein
VGLLLSVDSGYNAMIKLTRECESCGGSGQCSVAEVGTCLICQGVGSVLSREFKAFIYALYRDEVVYGMLFEIAKKLKADLSKS